MLKVEYGKFRREHYVLVIHIDSEGIVEFSPAGEGTKVSLYAFHTLLGLIV